MSVIRNSQRASDLRKERLRDELGDVKEAFMPVDPYEMQDAFVVESSIDTVLQDRTLGDGGTQSVRALTDAMRLSKALPLPQEAGTRVRFIANLGSVLTYDDIPGCGVEGTVVTVKSADGNVTHHEGRALVLWDDGKFRPILAEHLRLSSVAVKTASSYRMVVADLGDISSMFVTAGSGKDADELVHKATKDLWAVRKDGKKFVIERLFDDTGKPLKE